MVVCVGVVGVGLWAVAEPIAPAAVIARAVGSLAMALLGWAAILGAGRWLRAGVRATGLDRSRPEADDALADVALGLAVSTPVLGVALMLGALQAVTAVALAAIASTGLLVGGPVRWRRPGTGAWVALAVLAALLAPALVQGFAPPTDTDELYWQLAVPGRALAYGTTAGGWLDPVAARPLPAQLLYGALLAGGGELAPRLFAVLGAAVLAVALFRTIRHFGGSDLDATVGAGLLVGSWTWLEESALAHDNLLAALLVLAALDAALRGRSHRLVFVVACGAAVATKYTAAPAIVGVGLVWLATRAQESLGSPGGRWARAAGDLAVCGLAATVVVAPWWARNLLAGLHPLFPYAGWPEAGGFVYVYPEKYGIGHGLLDLVRLPWDLVVGAELHTFHYLGRLHPMWLAATVIVLGAAVIHPRVRVVALAGAVGVVGWFLGAQWMRHLLPVAPVLAVAAGLAMSTLPPMATRIALIAWAVLLPNQVLDHLERAAHALPVATGEITRDAWLEEEVPSWPAIRWVNEHLPPDARVAVLFIGETHLVERQTLLGSVEDHTPTRFLLVTEGPRALERLREAGATHVLAHRARFLRKSYPFLDDASFRAQFSDPAELLPLLLAQEATTMFEEGRYGVWALDGPTPPG